MKRPLILSLTAAVLVVPPTAFAAFSSGKYSGKTSDQYNSPVSFKVTQIRVNAKVVRKLSKLNIRVEFNCTDGDRFQTTLTGFPAQNIVRNRAGVGKYNATFTGSSGASRYVHKGSVQNKTATGTFTGRRTYDTEDQLDPRGTVICVTGTLRYTVRRPQP
jgi:hypothetical protein